MKRAGTKRPSPAGLDQALDEPHKAQACDTQDASTSVPAGSDGSAAAGRSAGGEMKARQRCPRQPPHRHRRHHHLTTTTTTAHATAHTTTTTIAAAAATSAAQPALTRRGRMARGSARTSMGRSSCSTRTARRS
eukprot:scaffold16593_cov51-Phaeocystis_antarctica.AAC.3